MDVTECIIEHHLCREIKRVEYYLLWPIQYGTFKYLFLEYSWVQ